MVDINFCTSENGVTVFDALKDMYVNNSAVEIELLIVADITIFGVIFVSASDAFWFCIFNAAKSGFHHSFQAAPQLLLFN